MFRKALILVSGVVVLILAATSALHAHCGKCAADKVKPAGKAKLVPIKIELPRPLFRGTPPELKKTRLDPTLPKEKAPRKPFLAPAGCVIVSRDKPASTSDLDPKIEIELANDGDKEGVDGTVIELGQGVQHVQVDFEAECEVHAIVLWHYHAEGRVYHDVIVQIADDPDFITNVRTLFNNDHDNSAGLGVGGDFEYVDEFDGRLIDAKGAKARYIRCYSNGSTANDNNHFLEVEVWGKPVK